MSHARMSHTLRTLDTWVDELTRQEAVGGPGHPYRVAHRRPYMQIVHDLRRAEARLAAAEAAYRKVTSPYLPQQDLTIVNRVIEEYQQARREVEALRQERDRAAQRLLPRLTRLRQRNPRWPRPISLSQHLRNLLRGRR
jgi:hypothetical protein